MTTINVPLFPLSVIYILSGFYQKRKGENSVNILEFFGSMMLFKKIASKSIFQVKWGFLSIARLGSTFLNSPLDNSIILAQTIEQGCTMFECCKLC